MNTVCIHFIFSDLHNIDLSNYIKLGDSFIPLHHPSWHRILWWLIITHKIHVPIVLNKHLRTDDFNFYFEIICGTKLQIQHIHHFQLHYYACDSIIVDQFLILNRSYPLRMILYASDQGNNLHSITEPIM